LHQTTSASEVASWGTTEKVKWWNGRDQLDQRVKTFLENMEYQLGPWRCLLSPCFRTMPSNISDTCTESLLTLFRTYSSAREPKKKAQKKGTHASTKDPIEDIDTVIKGVIPWLSMLLSPRNGLEKCERVTGLNEVLVCALSHLVEVDVDWARIEENALQVAIALVDAYITSDEAVASVGDEISAVLSSSTPSAPIKNSGVAAGCDAEAVGAMRSRVGLLKVTELKAELKDLGQDVSGKKSDLSVRLMECLEAQMQGSHTEDRKQHVIQSAASGGTSSSSMSGKSIPAGRSNSHVTLILDESLQAIPWESIPLLRASSCSRVPSLTVLVNLLQSKPVSNLLDTEALAIPADKKSKAKGSKASSSSRAGTGGMENGHARDHEISIARCWYAIDPDANLERTRETMMTFIEPFATKWQWPGYAGQRPPEEVIRKCHESSELFVYCGHGSGEKLFDKGNK
jgi:hypothetical protein